MASPVMGARSQSDPHIGDGTGRTAVHVAQVLAQSLKAAK